MKIIKSIIQRIKPVEGRDYIQYELVAQYFSDYITDFPMGELRNELIKKMAEEIYPDIKSKLLNPPEFEKITSEIRMTIAKKFINE